MNSIQKVKTAPKQIWIKILNYGVRASVLILFALLFFGRINPARIAEPMKKSLSLAKSAFYFRGLTEDIVTLEESDDSSFEENPFETMDEFSEDSYEDFYRMLEMMAAEDEAEEASEDWDEEDDDVLAFDEAEKIELQKYKDTWSAFADEHPEIASVLTFDRTASLFTFFLVILALIGVFLSFGSGLFKKLGFIISIAGSVLTAASMALFNYAWQRLDSVSDSLDVSPIAPQGITAYIIFAVLVLAFSVALLILDKSPADEVSKLSVTPFQITFRVLALLLFVLLFIPGANPARISENINRNVSLFTSGFSYGTYTENLERALVRGWLPEYVTRIAWISSLIICIGVTAAGVGACMSVGNNKLKRYAHIILLAGSAVAFFALFGILYAYNLFVSSPNIDRILPAEPSVIIIYFVLLAIIFATSLFSFFKTPAPAADDKCKIEAPYQLFLMLLPALILVFIFSYLPLWGWRYAFFDYNPGDTLSLDSWVGLKWFKYPFENSATTADILRVLRNTLIMSGLGILGSWLPMAFAIFLAEIRNTTARKIIQTLTTIPNFISWVLVYAIAFCIFGTQGFISSLFVNNGIWESGKNMLMGDSFIWIKMWLWGTWKGLGWSAIMYIAAISGIDQQLYEAATVDGAGRFQKIWHITVPELLPTYIVLLILSISGILSNGMDQYLCFKNPDNKGPIEVLDLYVYQITFGATSNSNIPFSTVVSMFKSLVSVILLFITNRISKWVRGSSIF
ncbi:MAG: ABC transporter permease subunit [Treponema sp.]|nr:ABC transporter permease subunit [Treponema sp.]